MMDNPPTTPFMAFPGGLPSLHWVAPLTAIPSGVNGRRGNDAAVILRGEAGMRRVLAAVTLSVVGLYLAYALFDGYFTRAIVGETFAKLGLTGMINNGFETQFPILFAFDSPVRKDRDFFSVFSKNRSEFVVTRIEVTLIISRLNLPPKSKVPLISVAPAAPESIHEPLSFEDVAPATAGDIYLGEPPGPNPEPDLSKSNSTQILLNTSKECLTENGLHLSPGFGLTEETRAAAACGFPLPQDVSESLRSGGQFTWTWSAHAEGNRRPIRLVAVPVNFLVSVAKSVGSLFERVN